MVLYTLILGAMFTGIAAMSVIIALHGARDRIEYWILLGVLISYMGIAVLWLMQLEVL
jgi:hypothetical protein